MDQTDAMVTQKIMRANNKSTHLNTTRMQANVPYKTMTTSARQDCKIHILHGEGLHVPSVPLFVKYVPVQF